MSDVLFWCAVGLLFGAGLFFAVEWLAKRGIGHDND